MRSKGGSILKLKEKIMIESILVKREAKAKTKLTVKSLLSVGLVALATILPMLVHLAVGAQGGMVWLPMYLPVVIGGVLLGTLWGVGIAIASPLVSFIITSIVSSPMPALSRLPFMIVELVVFALVCGLFSKLIAKKVWVTPIAVVSSIVAGRLVFLALVAIFESVSSLSVSMVLSQIVAGWPGVIMLVALTTILTLILNKTLNREEI